ncbi:hypothetical protein PHMEG_0009270 [Phytophthora megakarya]|uniref:Uncharacterized protein n=1 Tax=Phytophthora megakarya TaxID=4795 RepID=A0A225WGL9_9STRA|nr:hypothetical protein PHMEG_0009270 [Phytophthora megakarya]
MSASGNFYYLRPGTFEVVGFAYGRTEGLISRRGKMTVSLLRSGRWATEEEQEVEIYCGDISEREVTEAGTLMGPGAFVGSAVCITRVPLGGARVWVYGLVVDYSWSTEQKEGFLDLNFGDTVESMPYKLDSFQDLTVEIYALRPCASRGTSAVMPGELKRIHQEMYDKFNGIGQAAVRDVKDLATDSRATAADEAAVLPIFDIASSELSHVMVKHILDYVYYKDGKRSPPPGLVLHDSIFTRDEELRPVGNAAPQQLDDGLSDSDDDDSFVPACAAYSRSTDEPPRKRRRTSSGKSPRGVVAEDKLQELRARCEGDRDLLTDIDHLISLRRVGATAERNGLITMPVSGATEDKSHFQPSGTQNRIHQALIHGTFAYMSPQRLLSMYRYIGIRTASFRTLLCARSLQLGLWYPRVSIMHFVRITDQEKRDAVRQHDMSSFSRKNTLPQRRPVTDFSTVLGVIDVLSNMANQLYRTVIQELFTEASGLLLELRVREMPISGRALLELVSWIDDRLELFRAHVADNAMLQATSIKAQFNTSHELILRQDVEPALEESRAIGSSSRLEGHPTRKAAGSFDKRRAKSPVPIQVLKALAKQGGKAVCIRYLSQEGCRGWGGNCRVDGRAHFEPAALDDLVMKYIQKTYGGLSADMQ